MKKWENPELFELKAEWTKNVTNSAGGDSWGETGKDPATGDTVELGSCC